MKSFRKIFLVVVVLVVLFLLIGFPGNAANNTSDTTRTITMYPSVSTDPSAYDQEYVSALQASTTDPYYAESAFLYVGTAGSTIYDTALLKSTGGGDHQISSQNFDAVTAYDGLITTGDERGYSYSETKVYDPQTHTSHEIYPYAPYASYSASSETINYGNSTGVDDAKTYNGINENITESNTGEYRPSTMGSGDDTGESVVTLWDADGTYYTVKRGETMEIDEWDVGYVGGTIDRVELWVNFTVDSPVNYKGDNSLQYRKEGGTYQDTTITPVDDDVKNETYFVISDYISFNSVQELEDLDVRFVNNDAPPFDDPVYFDRVWLVVTSGYQMDIQHSIASIPSGADAYVLWIYGNYTSGAQEGDKINVEVQNFQFGWDSLGSLEITPAQGWYRFSLDPGRQLLGNSITIRYSDTTPDTEESTISIDVVQVRVYAGTLDYDLDMYYNFTWSETGDEKNISIYDVRSSSQDVDLYIFDWEATPSPQWVLLTPNATFSIDNSYTNYTYILNSNPERFIDDTTDEIRIRYLETDSSDSSSLKVDYLGVNIHSVAGSDQKINIEYDIDDFTGDRSTVTQIRVVDSSIVSSGSVNVQVFNFTSYQWEACFDVTDTDPIPDHSLSFSTSASDLISTNPGNILIRYVFSDNTAATLSVDYLRVDVTYTSEDGGNGGGGGDGGTDDGGGGDGGTTIIRTLSTQITYPEEIEKFVPAEFDVTLNDDEGTFVSNASVTLTFGNETESYELEEKEGHYKLLLETDTRDTGNYTFTISAEKSGFRDFLSSALPFNIVVKYPFATAVQYPEYRSEYTSLALKLDISVLLDPSLYVLPVIVAALITLQVTTFASIDPRKLRSIYVFTNAGQGIYYRSFFEEKGSVDSQLMSAALSGIVSLVMEATRSAKPLRTIDIETFEIFLEYGQYVTIATFVGKRIFYKRKIRRGQRKLIDNIERRYSHVLVDWSGDLSHFYELNQFVFDAFDFKLTKDLSTLIAGAAKVQLDLVSLYSSQEKFHMSSRALWKAYDLYNKIGNPRAQFILQRWKALEKAYLVDYFGSTRLIRIRILSMFFGILDFIRTAGLLKILYKIRNLIYPEISKELYYFIPPEQLTERTDEGI